MDELKIDVDCLIKILSRSSFDKNFKIKLEFQGDKLNSSDVVLTKELITESKQHEENMENNFKLKINDVGKIKKIVLIQCENLNENFILEIQLEIPYRNELLIFPVDQIFDNKKNLCLEPNLKPGETGTHYVITTHTGNKQNNKSDYLNVSVQIIGNNSQTKFIPLRHSQLNKISFRAGRKDMFDFFATDVGTIAKLILINNSKLEEKNNIDLSWHIENLEVKTLNNSHIYNFCVNKHLSLNESVSITPMTNTEIEYEVVLRYYFIEKSQSISHKHSPKLTDIYFIISGEKGTSKKLCINNYEIRKPDNDESKQKFFEFKSEDVGNIKQINVSITDDDNPNNCLYVDFIEIKIPHRSEAYKFPVERTLGAFYEDGKCELDLEVWKHPERTAHIDYEVISETLDGHEKEAKGFVYLIIHGDHGKTGKIELNDGKFNFSPVDNYEFNAPDVGKISKIELFFSPFQTHSSWQLETIEVKVSSRNEAYKFPIHLTLNTQNNYLELFPWKKPIIPVKK